MWKSTRIRADLDARFFCGCGVKNDGDQTVTPLSSGESGY